MKTSSSLYSFVSLILIAATGAVFGYNLYQVIVHPGASNIAITLILAVIVSAMIRKYDKTIK